MRLLPMLGFSLKGTIFPPLSPFSHICSDLHCCAAWAADGSFGVHLSPHPTHLVDLKTASVDTKQAFGPSYSATVSKRRLVVLHSEAFALNRFVFLPIMNMYAKRFRSTLPLQNSGLDCRALSPEGMHQEVVYFSSLVSSL